ncbi:MAG: PIN domain-containing protein [Gemmataceae bacterium]|nr:PIN domain-containing protein [Gemmataceae bacterium]
MIVYLDTNVVIYAVEKHPVFGPKVAVRLATARTARDSLMVSDLTRMESLVGPLKSGDTTLQGHFRAFFALPEVQVVAITPAVCDRAALIRATSKFKPMDSLHLATAVEHGASVFLTGDARLASFTGLTVEVLK